MLENYDFRARINAQSLKDAEKYDLPRILSQYAAAFEEVFAASSRN